MPTATRRRSVKGTRDRGPGTDRGRAAGAAAVVAASFLCVVAAHAMAPDGGAGAPSAETRDGGSYTVLAADRASRYTGFRTEGGEKKYYEEGELRKDGFIYYLGGLYLAGADGSLATGWHEAEDGRIYFFSDSGRSEEGWIGDGGNEYFLSGGVLLYGWAYLEKDGKEGWFFFGEDGKLLKDAVTEDGYYVDAEGFYVDEAGTGYGGEGFSWDKDRTGTGWVSGLTIAGMPAEFYMLSIAGETSGTANAESVAGGDNGRAYGVVQFDYRHDLVPFMEFAYKKHPDLWPAFGKYLDTPSGDGSLVYNENIGRAFLSAMGADYETAVSDQLEFARKRYWDGFAASMGGAGLDVGSWPVAVKAALFSVNVNCGADAGLFSSVLSDAMADEEKIRAIYETRNNVLSKRRSDGTLKGTTGRYLESEPEMALDLLYGYVTIDSHADYGHGVSWHGNPFCGTVTTAAAEREPDAGEATASEAAASEATPSEAAKTEGAGDGNPDGAGRITEKEGFPVIYAERKPAEEPEAPEEATPPAVYPYAGGTDEGNGIRDGTADP